MSLVLDFFTSQILFLQTWNQIDDSPRVANPGPVKNGLSKMPKMSMLSIFGASISREKTPKKLKMSKMLNISPEIDIRAILVKK